MTSEELKKHISYQHLRNKRKTNIECISDEDLVEMDDIECLEEEDCIYYEQLSYSDLRFKEQIEIDEKPEAFKKDKALNTPNFVDDFKKNNFKDLFRKASFSLQVTKDRDEVLAPFFKLVTEASLKRIFKANRMLDFLNELEQFFNSGLFNEHEKKSFLNGEVAACLLYSLNAKNFQLARTINKYRKDKSFNNLYDYIIKKIREEEYDILDNLFELSDSVTTNNSQILRMFYSNSCRNFDKVKYFIEKYHLDINGLGTTPGTYNKLTFSHLVTHTDGTKASIFFENFIKSFNNKIDFDIQAFDAHTKKKFNLLELLIDSQLEITTKLNRLDIILKNCALSEKHIALIVQYLVDMNNGIIIRHYDNDVYNALFGHEKFNSSLYDREAFLNKLLLMDNSGQFYTTRNASNFTVNPTSIILDKFLKHAQPALPMQQHPLITWVQYQNEHYSRDTFKSLMIFYADEIHDFDFKNIKINSTLAKALEENGMTIPEKKSMFSFWKKKKPPVAVKVVDAPSVKKVEEKKIPVNKLDFNTILFEQVKDGDVKRYIDSIILNAEQFDMLTNNKYDIETVHYMHTLLPKFLNKTIDNYLHFSMLDEEGNAKDNVLVQLKLINKKTFEVLSQSLEYEKNQILKDGSIHHKVMQNY